MKSVKGIQLNRLLGSLKRRSIGHNKFTNSSDDTPEAVATRSLILFCESEKTDEPDGDLPNLPALVEACESSPSAAKEAAYLIRKYLSKDYYNRAHVQYNSVMLIRILADNPGPTFTRNFDAKFVQAIQDLLRTGRDPKVRQIIIQTLDKFQRDNLYYDNIELLVGMWQKEQERMRMGQAYFERPPAPRMPQGFVRPPVGLPFGQANQVLPPVLELSMRIEEAYSSANLLIDVINSTSINEIINHDLAQELAQRCQLASQSMQAYISASNQVPDNDTMETLIETNEKLSNALILHQRTILKSRKLQAENSAQELALQETKLSMSSSRNENELMPSETPNPFLDSEDEKNDSSSQSKAPEGPDRNTRIRVTGSEGLSGKEENNEPPRKPPIYRY